MLGLQSKKDDGSQCPPCSQKKAAHEYDGCGMMFALRPIKVSPGKGGDCKVSYMWKRLWSEQRSSKRVSYSPKLNLESCSVSIV